MIASAALLAISYFKKDADENFAAYAAAYLRPAFLSAFALQAVTGLVMLFAQKPAIFAALTGGDHAMTIVLWTGVAGALAQAVIAHLKSSTIFRKWNVISLIAATALTLILMAVVRDFIRDAEIGAAFSYMNNPYQWNFVVLGAFLVTLAGGAATVAYMLFGLKEIK
jgi:hypothetical protein